MDPTFVAWLEELREAYGLAMVLRSARRCKWWNDHPAVKGAPKSMHLRGLAVDVRAVGKAQARLIALAIRMGATGIGVGSTFVHIDMRPRQKGLPPARWGY